jgi:hypothetical protein
MNQNTIQDLELLAKSVLHAVNQGTMTFSDAHTALSEKGFNIEADIAIIEDIGKDIEALAEVAKSFIVFLHDILPSNKTKATLSDGKLLEMKYYETHDTFQARIDKEEALIAKK